MTSRMLSDEKESLLLKIPPTVNIEVVEDSEEEDEYDNADNLGRKESLLPSGSTGYPPSNEQFSKQHRLSVPYSHRSSEGSAGSGGSSKRNSFESQRLSIVSNLSSRRLSSARTMSQNMQQNLRAIRQEQYRLRVRALMERNSYLGEKRRFCECVTMMSALSIFTAFTLYIIFAYGFTIFGTKNPFNVVEPPRPNTRDGIKGMENDTVEFLCRTDSPWEWCRWIHLDMYCDYEWKGWYVGDETNSGNPGLVSIGCDFPPGKVEFFGSYEKHECGLRVHHLTVRDRGYWYCEMEKYYLGFDRRYGEISTSNVHISVTELPKEKEKVNKSLLSSSSNTRQQLSSNDSALGGTSNGADRDNGDNIKNPSESKPDIRTGNGDISSSEVIPEKTTEEEEYQKKFFMLKVFVLGGVGSVLTLLAVLFWVYFMYLWKTLDNSLKRDHVIGGGPRGGVDHAAMAVQEAANQAALEKAAQALAEAGAAHFTTGMLADDMIQVLAGYNLEGMKLPTAAMKPTGTNVGESVTNSRIGADACINIDDADRKRSVSFAPASNEDDVNRISIGGGVGSITPTPLRQDGNAFNFASGDISQMATAGVPLIFPGALGVGNPGINPQMRKKYGSRRGKKSNTGFTDVASFTRMAKRFKRVVTSKIEEKAIGQVGSGSNLASQMASALLTGNVNMSSAEPSPSLNPKLGSPKKKQPSGDFIVMKKSANTPTGRRERNVEEENKQYKSHTPEKRGRSPLPSEITNIKEKETDTSLSTSKQTAVIIPAAPKTIKQRENEEKDISNEGIALENQTDAAQLTSECQKESISENSNEDMSSMNTAIII